MKKTINQTKIQKTSFFVVRCPLWDRKVVKIKRKENQKSLPAKISN